MLSNPETDFQGGEFCTLEQSGVLETRSFMKGDAAIFVSHKYHFIKPVVWGSRSVLV